MTFGPGRYPFSPADHVHPIPASMGGGNQFGFFTFQSALLVRSGYPGWKLWGSTPYLVGYGEGFAGMTGPPQVVGAGGLVGYPLVVCNQWCPVASDTRTIGIQGWISDITGTNVAESPLTPLSTGTLTSEDGIYNWNGEFYLDWEVIAGADLSTSGSPAGVYTTSGTIGYITNLIVEIT